MSVEPLEMRQMWSVSLDAAGYTAVTPTGGDRVVYVSSSAGSDGNSGLSASQPLKSLAAGVALLRDGRGDQLLLRRGDTWTGGFPGWVKSGDSSDNPMVLGAYGDGTRPIIATNGDAGFAAAAGGGVSVDHLFIQGITFDAVTRDPDSPQFNPGDVSRAGIGVQFFSGAHDILLEDLQVSHFVTNVVIQAGRGPISNVRLRRNVIVDAYSDGSIHSQGLYTDGVSGLLLEGNVFDHNGWNEKVSAAKPTIFNHDAYLASNTSGVVVKGNIFANASSHGLQARSGGDVLDNLFIADPLGMSYGLVRGDGSPTAGGVSGIINGNVFLGTRDINGQTRGVGIEIGNVGVNPDRPSLLSNNIFSNVAGNGVPWQAGGFAAINLNVGSGVDDATLAAGIRDLTIQGNVVYRWDKGLSLQSGMQPNAAGTNGYSGLVVKQNDFTDILASPVIDHPSAFESSAENWTGNRYDAGGSSVKSIHVAGFSNAGTPYLDANRSLAKYAGGDASAFLAGVRAMSESTGGIDSTMNAAAMIDYMRAGFTDPADTAGRNWNPPTAPTATALLPTAVATDQTTLTFQVTYHDDDGIDLSTLTGNEVRLVGRDGRHFSATLMSVDPGAAGDTKVVLATYIVHSPKAVWRSSDRGEYKVVADKQGVKDIDGFFLDSGTVLKAKVEVIVIPPPPTVKKVSFKRGKKSLPDRLEMTFSRDLAAAPSATTLQLALLSATDPLAAATPIDLSAATVTYDPIKYKAIWTFPAFANGQLQAGKYELKLLASGVTSLENGRHLDGNKDGLEGDDYLMSKPIKVKR